MFLKMIDGIVYLHHKDTRITLEWSELGNLKNKIEEIEDCFLKIINTCQGCDGDCNVDYSCECPCHWYYETNYNLEDSNDTEQKRLLDILDYFGDRIK